MAMDDGPPAVVDSVLFSGPTLAHIVQECAGGTGDSDGLLFGHVRRHTVAALQDDDETAGGGVGAAAAGGGGGGAAGREYVSALVTGHFASGRFMSFYDAVGAVDRAKVRVMVGDRAARGADSLIGWFVARRASSARPSMREAAVTAHLRRPVPVVVLPDEEDDAMEDAAVVVEQRSPGGTARGLRVGTMDVPLPDPARTGTGGSRGRQVAASPVSKTTTSTTTTALLPRCAPEQAGLAGSCPCLFLLLTESHTPNMVLTHDYRAFQYHPRTSSSTSGGEPGPAPATAAAAGGTFRPLPMSIVNIGPVFRGHYDAFAPVSPFPRMAGLLTDPDGHGEDPVTSAIATDAGQPLLDVYAQGFSMDRLVNLVAPSRASRTLELEDLYARMLAKLEVVARQVQDSSKLLAERESLRNSLKAQHEARLG